MLKDIYFNRQHWKRYVIFMWKVMLMKRNEADFILCRTEKNHQVQESKKLLKKAKEAKKEHCYSLEQTEIKRLSRI